MERKKITYIFNPFKNYFTPHVQCVPSHPPCWLSHHAGTCLDTHHITRSIFVVKRWHYIRGKVKVHTSLSVGHRTVVGLDCGTRSTKRLLVCARLRGCMQRNLGAIEKSDTQIKAGLWYRQVPLLILSHISIQVFQLAFLEFVGVSQSLVYVCAFCFSQCFFSGAACACPFGVVMVVALYLYARVSASRCALFCVYQCIWNCTYCAVMWDRL